METIKERMKGKKKYYLCYRGVRAGTIKMQESRQRNLSFLNDLIPKRVIVSRTQIIILVYWSCLSKIK